MSLTYGSVCSGIEAASVAWEPLGLKPEWFSEIDPFACAVLAHHWSSVPNLGDVNFADRHEQFTRPDIIVGGTPCQSFSRAGNKEGFDDPRGQLTHSFIRLIGAARPQWFVWENVWNVLSINGGRDFATIIGQMDELGYGVAWRILDAQHFGVPQRRRRLFVVGCLGDWRAAGKVLFEPESLHWNPKTNGKTKGSITGIPQGGSGVHGNGRRPTPFVKICRPDKRDGREIWRQSELCPTLTGFELTGSTVRSSVAIVEPNRISHTLTKRCESCTEDRTGRGTPLVAVGRRARKLTPRECERLQGFPDDHTRVPWRNKPPERCPDTPRYKAIGNSMAVPVMQWIGKRLLAVHQEQGFDSGESVTRVGHNKAET